MRKEEKKSGAQQIQDLASSIHPGVPLSMAQWLELNRILECIAAGGDVRKNYGIPPRKGAPSTAATRQKWMVLHFMALQAKTSVAAKTHHGIVATAWNTTDNEVRKLVAERSAQLRTTFLGTNPDAILATVSDLPAHLPSRRRL